MKGIAFTVLASCTVGLPTFARVPFPQSTIRQAAAKSSTKIPEIAAAPPSPSSVTIRQIRATIVGQSVQVLIVGSASLSCRPFRLSDPDRLVFDCSGTHLQTQLARVTVDSDRVRSVRVGQFKPDVARVVIDLGAPLTYTTSSESDTLVVTLSDKSAPNTPDPLRFANSEPAGHSPAPSPQPPTEQIERPAPGLPLAAVARYSTTEISSVAPSSRAAAPEPRNTVVTPTNSPAVDPNATNGANEAAPKIPESASSDREYVIGPKDLLSINVWRDSELSLSVPVRPDGKISLPLIGDVVASGLTPDALQHRITQGLDAYLRNPQVTVIVEQANSHKFYVIGQVAHPGAYPLATSVTVLDALATAGGLGQFAHSKQIYLLRSMPNGARQRIRFDYKAAVNGERAYSEIELQPGDSLVVP